MELPDVQNRKGDYGFRLRAGTTNMTIPITVRNPRLGLVTTVAKATMTVALPKHLKGINMSRLPIILNEMQEDNWCLDELEGVLDNVLAVLGTDEASIELEFPYFYSKSAPVSGHTGLAHVEVKFYAYKSKSLWKFRLTVTTPVTTLCPCSKEVSNNSAHNQRAFITIEVIYNDFVWIEDLIKYAEESASSEVYPILKRPDEKYVTERAYDNPHFVEDVARSVATKLEADARIATYRIEVRSEESIHQHDAFASLEKGM